MFTNPELLKSRPFYAGEGEEGSGGEEGGEGGLTPGSKVYTEDEFNAHAAGLRKKYEKQIATLQEQTKSLKLSAEAKKVLQGQIEEMQAQLRTAEEQKEHEKNQIETTYKQQLEDLQNQVGFWSSQFTETKLNRDLLEAASHKDHEAYNPIQIVELLKGKTKVVRDKDEEGNELPTFSTKVTISLPDSKTKQMTELVLTPKDAVKRMSEATELYGNLFKNNLKGGFDGTPNRGGKSGGAVDLDELARTDPAAYRAARLKEKQNA